MFQVDLYLLPDGVVPLAKPFINVLSPWLLMSEGEEAQVLCQAEKRSTFNGRSEAGLH